MRFKMFLTCLALASFSLIFAQHPENEAPDFYYLDGMENQEGETLRVYSCSIMAGKISIIEDTISSDMECPITLVSRSDLNQFIEDLDAPEDKKSRADLRVKWGAGAMLLFVGLNMERVRQQTLKVKKALIPLQSKRAHAVLAIGSLTGAFILFTSITEENESLIHQIHEGVVKGDQKAFADFLEDFGRPAH